jgi:uncharacterized membrane protein
MFIVLLPFPNDLIGKYPTQQIAVVVYAIIIIATGMSLSLLWLHASGRRRLIDESLSADFIRGLTIRLSFNLPCIFGYRYPFLP